MEIWRDFIEPEDTSLIWARLNESGELVGYFKYDSGKWISIKKRDLESTSLNLNEIEDNNILSVYKQDANWGQYVTSGKVDTWYNYINDPDANPDYITSPIIND